MHPSLVQGQRDGLPHKALQGCGVGFACLRAASGAVRQQLWLGSSFSVSYALCRDEELTWDVGDTGAFRFRWFLNCSVLLVTLDVVFLFFFDLLRYFFLLTVA